MGWGPASRVGWGRGSGRQSGRDQVQGPLQGKAEPQVGEKAEMARESARPRGSSLRGVGALAGSAAVGGVAGVSAAWSDISPGCRLGRADRMRKGLRGVGG